MLKYIVCSSCIEQPIIFDNMVTIYHKDNKLVTKNTNCERMEKAVDLCFPGYISQP